MRTEKKSLGVYVCVCVVVLCPAALGELSEPFCLCGKPFLQVANRFSDLGAGVVCRGGRVGGVQTDRNLGAESDDGQAGSGAGLSVSFRRRRRKI